jgi:hypothetical protein
MIHSLSDALQNSQLLFPFDFGIWIRKAGFFSLLSFLLAVFLVLADVFVQIHSIDVLHHEVEGVVVLSPKAESNVFNDISIMSCYL